jgi:DMSO/TMAO reductase YedYZ molybdopterin-dependent catalytic subunit
MKRRKFIKITAITAASAMAPIRYLDAVSEPDITLKPDTLITPNADFYILQINEPVHIKAEQWRLVITGLVDRPGTVFDYKTITGMESVDTMRTLKCIGDPIGTEQMSNAMWTGVPLRDILNKAGVKKAAKMVVFRCQDTYHTAIPLADAMRPETLLAHKMNGEPLPVEHGFPVRLLNPGHYGTKNPKWIVNIHLAESHVGYWEKQGWDPIASVKLAAMIGTPREGLRIKRGTVYTISGAAFDSGNHKGIESVEVSVDGGETWEEAEIWAGESPLAWSLWKYRWQAPEQTGNVEIYARAIAQDGLIQRETGFDADPAGAVGYHTVMAEVVE